MLARIPREELASCWRATATSRISSTRTRSPGDAPRDGGDARSHDRADPRDSDRSARARGHRERPRWPMIVLADAEGLDRAGRGRRRPGRGHLALASGAARQARREAEHLRLLEEWMRATARGALHRRGPPAARARGARAGGPTSHERQPARERRHAAARAAASRLPRLRGRRSSSPARVEAEATRVQGAFMRDVMKLNLREQLPHLQSRRAHLESLGRRARGDLRACRARRSSTPTRTWRPTAASSRC